MTKPGGCIIKIRDESQWQEWLAEIARDPTPAATDFRDFVVTWAEGAEVIMGKERKYSKTPIAALNAALETTLATHEWVPTLILGQALLVLCTHWDCGVTPDDFHACLSPIERHLFAEVAILKFAELHAAAQSIGEDA